MQKTKSRKNLVHSRLNTFVIFMLMFFFFYKAYDIYKDTKVKAKNEMFKSDMLLNFQSEATLKYTDKITQYLKNYFPNLTEYRIISINADNLDVLIDIIIDEPIKEDSIVGYSLSNYYRMKALVTSREIIIEHLSYYKEPKLTYDDITLFNFTNKVELFLDNLFEKNDEATKAADKRELKGYIQNPLVIVNVNENRVYEYN